MTSKSISITTEVYALLDKFRLKNENFSQAILRLLSTQADLQDLAGSWAKISDAKATIALVEKTVKKIHETTVEPINLE
jgi:predicted CopG family antitoxin